MVVGFAAWVLGTQGSLPRENAETPPESGRIDDDSFFDDETPEPTRLADSAKSQRSNPPRSARIQPELGRLSDRDREAIAADDVDELDLAAEEAVRQPRAQRITSRPAMVFRPADSLQNSESARIESHLTALQKKIDQLVQAQTDQKTNDVQKAIETLQQIQESKHAEQIEKLLQQLKDAQLSAADPAKLLEPTSDTPKSNAPSEPLADDNKPGVMQFQPAEGHQDRFDNIDFDDVDISKALAALGQLSGMNILVGRGVIGRVTANLQNVTAEEALDAITKSLGYVYEREGNFVFVWTATDSLARKQAARKTVSKVFRPRYVSVKDLQLLITPMLTKPIGLIAATTPAEIDLEESRTKVGGNRLAQTDALLIVDYPEVISQVELVLADIDVPPSQVVIEAMILSVKLTDSMKLAVNFALLNGSNKPLVTTGSGTQFNSNVGFNKDTLLPIAGDFFASTAGLKYGFINGDLAGFVEALETLAETSVVASPSVRVLNKQKAELIIGQRLGHKATTFNGTQSIENINFLEVGTKLLLRPFVNQDGLIRMEIHPERSDGTINDAGLPQSRTTEVTSNVMIRDGATIVVGGLIAEQANQTQSRVPGLGALPVVGNLFKNKSNDTTRTELIVLITPHIIRDPGAECEGDLSRSENERAARRLRDQIAAAINDKNWIKKLRRKPPPENHRAPSAPNSLSGEAIFEQEIPTPVPSPFAPVPPAPAAMPEVLKPSTDDATAKNDQ